MIVRENACVLRLEGTEPRLWRAGQPQSDPAPASVALPKNTVFAAPADTVRLYSRHIAPDEAKHLAKALPYLLEDEVIDDVDDLHFAYQPIDDEQYLIAIVRNEQMHEWQAALPEQWQGRWLPEALLLPWQPGEVCIVMESDSAIVRFGQWTGTRIERSLIAPLLAGLDAEPTAIIIYGQQQTEDTDAVPEHLQSLVQWRQGNLGSALLLAQDAPAFDLRQGRFAPRLPLGRWWHLWQRVAMAAGVALVLQLGADLAQYQRLKADNTRIRQAIQDSYRQANPKGAVVDVEKQLDRQIAEFNPSSTAVAFTPLLAAITAGLAEQGGISLSTVNFSASSGEVRLDLTAADFAAVEALRQLLGRRGLDATLETSSSRDELVRARLRVAGTPMGMGE